jgi:hypothetical protein
VTNSITVKPAVPPETVEEIIEKAFKREAEVDAREFKVEVSDSHREALRARALSEGGQRRGGRGARHR